MPFTAHDLRYKAEETYPALYAHLSRHAQRFLGSLKFDAYELDVVVGHVVEQLVRIGLIGGGNKTPRTALDDLTPAQFYAFLNRSIKNKAIDRLRKRRFQVSSAAEFEEGLEGDDNPLNDVTESLWGAPPFATPEEVTLGLASQQELRGMLKHCIQTLSVAPRQLQAVLMELKEFDAVDLLQDVVEELKENNSVTAFDADTTIAHASQHKDHAHKKLRHCLQENSTHLTVLIALRLTEYGVRSTPANEFVVKIQALAQEGLLDWDGDAVVRITSTQMKRLARFYKDE